MARNNKNRAPPIAMASTSKKSPTKTYRKNRTFKHQPAADYSDEDGITTTHASTQGSSSLRKETPRSPVATRSAKRKANDVQSDVENPPVHSKVGPPGGKKKARIVGATPSARSLNRAFVDLTSKPVSLVKAGPAAPSHPSTPEPLQHAESPTMFEVNGSPINQSDFTLKNAGQIEDPAPITIPPSIIDLSSDDDASHSLPSDTPSQLLEEIQKHTPDELLKEARTLALRLPQSVPEALPGDLLYVWDANSMDTILSSLPGGGTDPSEDVEDVDHTLNGVFQGTSVSRLVQEMRRGPCGPLGIVEGLDFFAKHRNLNLVQFEIKLLKLVKALRRCVPSESGVQPHSLQSPIRRRHPSVTHHQNESPTRASRTSRTRLPAARAHSDNHVSRYTPVQAGDHEEEDESGVEGDSSELDDGDTTEEDDPETNTAANPGARVHKSYATGPLPIELADEVRGLTQAFNDALAKVAEKHNRPLHQVQRLANLNSTLKAKRAPNPFNGYARKRKNEGLSTVSQSKLKDEYLKEKSAFDGDPEGLELWLEDLRTLAQGSRVDNDIKLTKGSKLAKFMVRKKKALKAEMSHMAKFDVHTLAFVVAARPDAYAAHAQNALLYGSPEIEKLAEGEFNLKESLNNLFVKVMHQRLDGNGLSKWHEDTEQAARAKELKSRDTAYSAASKYIKNLFAERSWFPNTVPWTRLLSLLVQHRLRIVGWPLEEECPAPHPQRGHKVWEGTEWRFLVAEFHKGKDCPIKLESWGPDEDDHVPLVIDRIGSVVYRVNDAVQRVSSHTSPSSSKAKDTVKDPRGRFTRRSRSKVSTSGPPLSSQRKGKKPQPKSAEFISSDDEVDQDPHAHGHAPDDPTSVSTGPVLPHARDGLRLDLPSGHPDALPGTMGQYPTNLGGMVGFPSAGSNNLGFNPGLLTPQPLDPSQVDWMMLYMDMMQHNPADTSHSFT